MKYGLATIVFVAAMVLLSGCGNSYDHENMTAAEQGNSEDTEEDSSLVISNESDKNGEVKNDAVQEEAEESVSDDYFSITEVEISFDFSRMSTKASNQIAAWIEDENGNIVKTIYVSDFAGARRGYKKREDAIPHWAAAADPDALSDEEIDAVSSATLQTGSQSFEWDLTDDEGNTVPAGRYTVKLGFQMQRRRKRSGYSVPF